MSEPSNWTLTNEALRVRTPKHCIAELTGHPLSKQCFPTAIGFYPEAKSHQMKRVVHDDYLLMYCVEGKGELVTDSYDSEISKGDLFIISPGTSHQYSADSQHPWTLFWCHFRGSQADAFYQYIRSASNDAQVNHLSDIDLFSSFNSLMNSARDSYSLAGFIHVSSLLRLTLTLIERKLKQTSREKSGIVLPVIHQFMRANLNKNISLDDLADLSHLSKYHFSRKYQALTGYSPLQHFTHLKIEHACFLLEQTDMTISMVAFELGYVDALYFSRVFRRVMKLSPSQYRKSLIALL
jgi:AraC-like DNA-binding protein